MKVISKRCSVASLTHTLTQSGIQVTGGPGGFWVITREVVLTLEKNVDNVGNTWIHVHIHAYKPTFILVRSLFDTMSPLFMLKRSGPHNVSSTSTHKNTFSGSRFCPGFVHILLRLIFFSNLVQGLNKMCL